MKIFQNVASFMMFRISLCLFLWPSLSKGVVINGATVTLQGSDRSSDNTALIQNYLNNTSYTKIEIEAGSGAWMTGPLFINRNNIELKLKTNAVLEAKPGAYSDLLAHVLTANSRVNIKITGEAGSKIVMQQSEYAAMMPASEWRHAIGFNSCVNVTIDGIVIERPGGDGILIGDATATQDGYSSNVTIKNVVIDSAVRNGISIISVNGLVISNCVVKNTHRVGNIGLNGPGAGIDFEPDSVAQTLQNITIENCVFKNNENHGFLLPTYALRGSMLPITLTVKGCLFQGNGQNGVHLKDIPNSVGLLGGSFLFEDCTFKNNKTYGLWVNQKGTLAGPVRFKNCYFKNNNLNNGSAPIAISNLAPPEAVGEICGNVIFENVVVEQTMERSASVPYCLFIDGNYGGINNITGNIVRSGGTILTVGATMGVNVVLSNTTPSSHWKLNEVVGLTATDSTGGSDGTLRNGAVRIVGQSGGAMKLDGIDDFVEITSNAANTNIGTGDFSVAMWFQRFPDPNVLKRLLYKGASDTTDVGYALAGADTWLTFVMANGSAYKSVSMATTPNRWTHMVATIKRGDKICIYKDGIIQQSANIADWGTVNITNGLNTLIGKCGGLTTLNWPGLVDDIRIYKRALVAGEAAEFVNVPSVHWRLNESSGTSAVDHEGRSNGEVQNGAAWTASKVANGLQLDGFNDQVQVSTNAADLNIGKEDFTVAMWFRRTANPNVLKRLLYKGSSDTVDVGYALTGADTWLTFVMANGSSYKSVSMATVVGQWIHVAVTVRRNEMLRIYKNGILQDSIDISGWNGADLVSNQNLLMGACAGLPSLNWPGSIDDVRIYKRALSADQVDELANIASP